MQENATIVRANIAGIADLLMHNPQLANPLNPWARKLKELTGKHRKSEADYQEISRLEFYGGLYYSPDVGVYLSDDMALGVLVAGAQPPALADRFQAAVLVERHSPLRYQGGPLTPDEMWESGNFHDVRYVDVRGSKVSRCRPRFRGWTTTVEIKVLPGCGVEVADVQQALEKGGRFKGVGDYHPRFGRFRVTEWVRVLDHQPRS